MDEIETLQADIQKLRNYADSLEDAAEKADVMGEVQDAQSRLDTMKRLKKYAEPQGNSTADADTEEENSVPDEEEETTGETDGDSMDDLSDADMQELIESLKAEGFDAEDGGDDDAGAGDGDGDEGATPPANMPPAMADKMGGKAAKSYSEEPGTPAKAAGTVKSYAEIRLERMATESIDKRVNGLVEAGKITPADAPAVKRTCYTLSGLDGQGVLKAYSDSERDDAVNHLLGVLGGNADLGILRSYTETSHTDQQARRSALQNPPMAGNTKGGVLDQKIRMYMAERKITDYGKAASAFEKEFGRDVVKQYSEEE